MESDLPSTQLGYLLDINDAMDIAEMSMVIVATIQEVKNRISHIEYIFCSKLYPDIQSGSKSSCKQFVEAMKLAEDGWRKKESSLLSQIEELQFEKNNALEENQKLVASLEEKAKLTNHEFKKATEDDWKRKESLLLVQIEEIRLEKQQAVEENRCLVVSLQKEKTKLLYNEQLLNELEMEKKLFVAKLESLQENEEVADHQLKQKAEDVADRRCAQERLLQQLELKDMEIMNEKKKRREVIDTYKKLKSQYNFLCSKFGLKDKDPQTSGPASMMNEQKGANNLQEKLDDSIVSRLSDYSSTRSNIKTPSLSTSCSLKSPASVKSEPLAGNKRSVPPWRDTRSRQEAEGADPHDDFLDTPMDNIKGNLNKVLKQEVQDYPVLAPKDVSLDSLDDETQDMNVEPSPQKQQISITRTGDRGFKYVEPVRKKSDRENLKGFECKQCKKFYDAVIPDK
ncbi:gamma response, partial [Thalictrum thalictroides]